MCIAEPKHLERTCKEIQSQAFCKPIFSVSRTSIKYKKLWNPKDLILNFNANNEHNMRTRYHTWVKKSYVIYQQVEYNVSPLNEDSLRRRKHHLLHFDTKQKSKPAKPDNEAS